MQNLRDASFSINKVITKYNMLNNITKTSCVIINILISENNLKNDLIAKLKNYSLSSINYINDSQMTLSFNEYILPLKLERILKNKNLNVKIINAFFRNYFNIINGIMKIGYQSLRKISKYFEIFLKIRVSHQTIKNWSNKNHKETINNEEFEYSGYYLYDEQFLRLNGVRHYRLTLFDAILNVPVSERIVRRRIPKNTKKFILDSTKNKPFICLTTDLFPMYRKYSR